MPGRASHGTENGKELTKAYGEHCELVVEQNSFSKAASETVPALKLPANSECRERCERYVQIQAFVHQASSTSFARNDRN